MLTDGVRASSLYSDGYWAGVEGDDLEVLLDLGTETEISKIFAGFLEAQSYWIFHPLKTEFSLSHDGRKFYTQKIITRDRLSVNENRVIKDFSIQYKNEKCRYIRMKAQNVKVCSKWHKGAGGKAWLFVDEIIIE